MNKYPLVIINNEKVFNDSSNFYCENYDIKTLTEGLNEYHPVTFIARNSSKKGRQKINLRDIKLANNFIKFIFLIFETLKKKDSRYLIISLTPYTFISFLILFLFRKKPYLYLMSSGHEEYKNILGSWSVWIYHLMYLISTSYSKVIVNHKRLYKKNCHILKSSRLNEKWFKNINHISLDKIKLLYVGRLNPEKGIYNFLEIFNKIESKVEFSIAGTIKKLNIKNENIKMLGYIADEDELIKIYDKHNIMILPSFTEAQPYVLDECLSRKRPVIIFEDIDYVVGDREGVIISKREAISFSNSLSYIKENYYQIQKNMDKNVLPTKKDMLKQLAEILSQ